MSHLVKPTSFRVGKTLVWPHNSLLSTKQELVNSNLALAKGIEKVSKSLLRRKRLYVVRGNIVNFINSSIYYNLLFMPRVKTKPREHNIGAFLRKAVYKPFNFSNQSDLAKNYIHARKDKLAKLRRRFRPKRLNRWLSKRMFRGSSKVIWKKSRSFRLLNFTQPRYIEDLGVNAVFSLDNTADKQGAYLKPALTRKVHRFRYTVLPRRQKWRHDRLVKRRFNDKKFSSVLSKVLHRDLSINAINLFSYLVSKRVVDFKTHQNHFWNFRYRRYRFQYKNYFDIANAFFSLGVVDNSEGFLLSILKITLPLILKIRKFFKFLNSIIKHMPEIQEKYDVFKISITGKLAGGTKRTKFHSIGYGVLPVQTLSCLATSNFIAYTHIYGEFGVKLTMAKNPKYLGPKMFM